MSATCFTHDCPYCGTRKAGFEFSHARQTREDKHLCQGSAVCGVCDQTIVVTYTDETISASGKAFDLKSHRVDFPSNKFKLKRVIPREFGDMPERLPDNVKSFFLQGMTNELNENWDASGAMFRKSIDVGTKIIEPKYASDNLFTRINKLSAEGRLTKDISIWAHEVRIDGNDSVHGDEPETPEDVSAIHEFSKAVLLYLFTLPALVQERSSKRQKPS